MSKLSNVTFELNLKVQDVDAFSYGKNSKEIQVLKY
jgi:hypothetical protein